MISLKQKDEFGKKVFTELNNPDFVKFAESIGLIGYDVKSTEDFPKVLKKVKDSTHIPVIVSIDLDYSGNRILLDDNFRYY